MKDLFDNEIEVPKKGNPMIRKSGGHGPTDKKCKHCKYFYKKVYAKTYFKCELRGDTNGTGTDHRANWPTCKFFLE